MWDPNRYASFAPERSRPFADLMARVRPGADTSWGPPPRVVVDLGCGDGPLTLSLARRWPTARMVGIDSSPEMLAAARSRDLAGEVQWRQADITDWDPAKDGPIDVLVSNAALQWVPSHRDLLPRWAAQLAPGGWLALQVPGNFEAPSHRLMREVAAGHPRAAELLGPLQRAAASDDPEGYLRLLAGAGLTVEAWETTYLHVLDPEGASACPVLDWISATGLRPALDVLTHPDERADFLHRYQRALELAYPRRSYGVPFEFRRVFAVGHRPG